jgi:hypothetical protein
MQQQQMQMQADAGSYGPQTTAAPVALTAAEQSLLAQQQQVSGVLCFYFIASAMVTFFRAVYQHHKRTNDR